MPALNLMGFEIEHKYLVNQQLWKSIVPQKSVHIRQAYLFADPQKTIRVRTADQQGFITIKGKTNGASRLEFEYEIPRPEADELIRNFTDTSIEKIRHYVPFDNKTWEVDQFLGLNEGLFVAEVELLFEHEPYLVPTWVTENVTADGRYANANLMRNPFSSW